MEQIAKGNKYPSNSNWVLGSTTTDIRTTIMTMDGGTRTTTIWEAYRLMFYKGPVGF